MFRRVSSVCASGSRALTGAFDEDQFNRVRENIFRIGVDALVENEAENFLQNRAFLFDADRRRAQLELRVLLEKRGADRVEACKVRNCRSEIIASRTSSYLHGLGLAKWP